MIAKIQIKVGIRKYSNLKVVFWLFFTIPAQQKATTVTMAFGRAHPHAMRKASPDHKAPYISHFPDILQLLFHIFPYLLALKITFPLKIDHAGQKKEKIFSRIRKWCG